MNTLGVISFIGLFVMYAVGQEFSRRVANVPGPSFPIRFFRTAKRDLAALLFVWALCFFIGWGSSERGNAQMGFWTWTVIVLLINLIRTVELPKKQPPHGKET